MTPSLYDLVRADGNVYLSCYGSNLALGWSGSDAFTERFETIVTNVHFIGPNAMVHRATSNLFYVLVTAEGLERGLLEYLKACIRMKETTPVIATDEGDPEDENAEVRQTIEWDELAIDLQARSRLNLFMENHLRREDFIAQMHRGIDGSYGVYDRRATRLAS